MVMSYRNRKASLPCPLLVTTIAVSPLKQEAGAAPLVVKCCSVCRGAFPEMKRMPNPGNPQDHQQSSSVISARSCLAGYSSFFTGA